MGGIPMVKKHSYRVPNRSKKTNVTSGHSPNQSLVAHTGSATDSDHNLDATAVCKALSNVHDCVGQIKGLVVQN
eukprot:6205852-Pleurochrysis_carterae.AAC.1